MLDGLRIDEPEIQISGAQALRHRNRMTGLGLDAIASSSKKLACPARVESERSLAVSLAIDAV